jgi:hypothetical protein
VRPGTSDSLSLRPSTTANLDPTDPGTSRPRRTRGKHVKPRSAARRRVGTLAHLLVVAVAAGTALTGMTSPASAASAEDPMMFGAAASTQSEVQQHEKVLGSRLNGLRTYKSWDSDLFGRSADWERDTGHTLFMSIRSERQNGSKVMFADVANAQPGSRLYQDMQHQAQEIKAYGATVYIAYNHEPEASGGRALGNSAQFVAAYRKVQNVWKAAGVHNVRYVWAMTAYGFARHDQYNAANYYPGDDYVDYIAADGYNWYNCRGDGAGWVELANVIEAQRQFGMKHPSKGLMLYEFGSAEDRAHPGRKAQWLKDATALFQKPGYGQYKAIMSWEGRNFQGGGPGCGFDYLSSPSATKAWVDMAHTPAMRAVRLG